MPLGVLLHMGMSVHSAGICNQICLVCLNYCGIRGFLFVQVAHYLSSIVIQINLAFSTQRKPWLFSMHCLLHYGCTVCVQAQVKSVGQLQPPMSKCYKHQVHLGLISRGMGKIVKEGGDCQRQGRDPKKRIRLLCLLDGNNFSLTISSRSGLFQQKKKEHW